MPGSRLESKESFKRFKNKSSGFDFSYPSDSNFLNGYLLLSKYDPDEFIPKIELWDLNSQKMIHAWNINIKELYSLVPSENHAAMRFLHPLLLKDGSVITHIDPGTNASLLKFDKCGELIKTSGEIFSFHHSKEIDAEGRIMAQYIIHLKVIFIIIILIFKKI